MQKTGLIPPLFIELPVPSRASKRHLYIDFASVFSILLLDIHLSLIEFISNLLIFKSNTRSHSVDEVTMYMLVNIWWYCYDSHFIRQEWGESATKLTIWVKMLDTHNFKSV